MKKRIFWGILGWLILVTGFTILIANFTWYLYNNANPLEWDKVITFGVGLLSLVIAIIALYIALRTYVSIDSVSVISSMEGNVLCNENYNAQYLELVKQYSECCDVMSLEKKMFENIVIEILFKSSTCMEYADRIQSVLDHLLWYAYVDKDNKTYKRHIKILIFLIEKKYKKFSVISNGNQHILNEHIKLIKRVLEYQEKSVGSTVGENKESILNIRGRMFTNPVSKTLYYDYLGLEFYNTAKKLLEVELELDGDIFTTQNMNKIRESKKEKDSSKKEKRIELSMYLEKAQKAFEKARESSEEDILWNGYITFNLARVELLAALVEDEFKENWSKSIEAAEYARFTVLKLFVGGQGKDDVEKRHAEYIAKKKGNVLSTKKEDNDEKISYLETQFKQEHEYAKMLYYNMKLYVDKTINDLENAKKEIEEIHVIYEKKDLDTRTKVEERILDHTRDSLNLLREIAK